MTAFLNRYFAYHGRLARLPFFVRSFALGIATAALFIVVGVPLFANGGVWWWLGIMMLRSASSVWVHAAQGIWTFLANAPPKVMLLGLPLAAICFWVTFWPGNKEANRFGAVPD